MKAVRSIDTRGMISTSCSDATSSSSGGVTDVLSDGGSAISSAFYVYSKLLVGAESRWLGRWWTRRGGAGERGARRAMAAVAITWHDAWRGLPRLSL